MCHCSIWSGWLASIYHSSSILLHILPFNNTSVIILGFVTSTFHKPVFYIFLQFAHKILRGKENNPTGTLNRPSPRSTWIQWIHQWTFSEDALVKNILPLPKANRWTCIGYTWGSFIQDHCCSNSLMSHPF